MFMSCQIVNPNYLQKRAKCKASSSFPTLSFLIPIFITFVPQFLIVNNKSYDGDGYLYTGS